MKKQGLFVLFVGCFCCTAVNSCKTNLENIYTHQNVRPELSFIADIESTNTVKSYKIWSPDNETLLSIQYFKNQTVLGTFVFNNCFFTGNKETGDLKIQLGISYKSGLYRLDKGQSAEQCLTVFILGVPVTPIITTDHYPFVGENVTLTCSSTSTTAPTNHALILVYSWNVDGTENPIDSSKYTYTTLRRNLTLYTVTKQDRAKRFTCIAKENHTDANSSAKSNDFSITVYNGPDAVILSPPNKGYTIDEGNNLEDITCSADCFPNCTISWTKNGAGISAKYTEILNLGILNRQNSGNYTCTAISSVLPSKNQQAHVVIIVRYGPEESTTKLNPEQNLYTENENGAAIPNINCSSDCVPQCKYSWTKHQSGVITTVTESSVLSIGSPTRNDFATYTCTARNPDRTASPATRDVNIRVRYGPDEAVLSVSNTYTVTEGHPVGNITCSSVCYPSCSYAWKSNNSIPVKSGETLIFGTATRYQTGIYTCIASNSAPEYNRLIDKSTHVIVRYPPDVIMTAGNISVKQPYAVLKCIAQGGLPSFNYTYGEWIQLWNGFEILSRRNVGAGLTIFNLTYEHSGTYKCSVSNGLRAFNSDQEIYIEASAYLLVKSFPVIIKPDPRSTKLVKVPAKLKANATFLIEYFSNVDLPKIKCYKINDTAQTENLCNAEQYYKLIDLPVFSKIIPSDGGEANISINIDNEEDFGHYNVTFTNEIDTTFIVIDVKPEGVPNPPKDIVIDEIEQTSARLSWTPGFNGGFAQTFVVQLDSGSDNWRNKSVQKEDVLSTVLLGLEHSTHYFVRMYALNERGSSNFTEIYNFITQAKIDNKPIPAALIGGIAGGSVAAIVIVVIAMIVLKRRGVMNKGTDECRLDVNRKGRQQTEEDSSDEDVTVENTMYESAGQIMTRDEPVYNKPTKKVKVNTKNTDVYAVVDKSKKKENQQVKKEKPTKKKEIAQGDIYENSPEKSKTRNNTYGNAAFEDNPYENPEVSKPSKTPKKSINPDGLIYADLAFNDQPKGQKKLVIHGLDEMTTYVQVDFNKKADPLPDSDTEEQSEKKQI